jgi:hypothetical protein
MVTGWIDGWIVVAYIVLLGGGLLIAYWRRERRNKPIDPHTGKMLKVVGPSISRADVAWYIAAYVLYALLFPLLAIGWFIWYPVIRTGLPALGVAQEWVGLFSYLAMFAIWVAFAVYVVAAQMYLHGGVEQRRVPRRFAILASIAGGFVGIGLLFRLVLM